MKRKTLLSVIFSAFFFCGFSQNYNRAFAITGQAKGNFNWIDIRGIEMSSGNANAVLFENGKTKFSFRDAETQKAVDKISVIVNPALLKTNNATVSLNTILLHNPTPTSLMSAAIAYDKKHDKLFFASMHTGNLMWLDLRSTNETPSFYTIQKPLVENHNFDDEAFNITRMAIGADGNGYALTNDGNHLVRFSTGKKTIITDLGKLIDAESNKSISVHNPCSSWGGDMVADAFGKLYLFTANHNVFEIDIQSGIATYKGGVINLPPAY
jgi:hypothetical protein